MRLSGLELADVGLLNFEIGVGIKNGLCSKGFGLSGFT